MAGVGFRRLLGGGDSTGTNTSSSFSLSIVCLVSRLLLLGEGVDLASWILDLRRDREAELGSGAALTGDDKVEEGRDPSNPTKNGHVGVLFLCSCLHDQRQRIGNYRGSSFGSQPSRPMRQ